MFSYLPLFTSIHGYNTVILINGVLKQEIKALRDALHKTLDYKILYRINNY